MHSWKKITTEGSRPDGRDGHTASVVESQDTMLIFGGYVQKVGALFVSVVIYLLVLIVGIMYFESFIGQEVQ